MPRDQWTTNDFDVKEEVKCELKKSIIKANTLLNKSNSVVTAELCRYFSRYEKIVRLMAWIGRFLQNLRTKTSKSKRCNANLSCDELKFAERKLLRLLQQEMFCDESDSRLKFLCVFKDKQG